LAAALTAVKMKIPCAHLESGPRQFNLSNPEEANRIVVDHLSTLAFAPTKLSLANLRKEGLRDRATFVGDTMLDSMIEHLPSALKIDLSLKHTVGERFVLITIHRQENTDDAWRLRAIVRSLIHAKAIDFVFPLHPRTEKNLKRFSLWAQLSEARNVCLLSPVDYETNLALLAGSRAVVTDSGGLQKEAFWLGVPCVTVFETTPWPETFANGANRCVEPDAILRRLHDSASIRFDGRRYFSRFGNGKASENICRSLLRFCGHLTKD
jgi:UDP-N-acetylglucosamine 2-epimerase (non-hydrolysing)